MKQMNRKDMVAEEDPDNSVTSSLTTKVTITERDKPSDSLVPPLVIHNNFPNLTTKVTITERDKSNDSLVPRLVNHNNFPKLTKVTITERDKSSDSLVPPLVIHNNFPNLTITPVTNRSEPILKSPTEGSLKISIRYADITPPLKDKPFKPKLPSTVSSNPLNDAQPVDPLLSLPKGLTILPVASSSELSSSNSSSSKENIEPVNISLLSSITLHEIPSTKTAKDVPLPLVCNLTVEKVPDKPPEIPPITEASDLVDKPTVTDSEDSQSASNCTETSSKDLIAQTESSTVTSSNKETIPLVVHLEDNTVTKSIQPLVVDLVDNKLTKSIQPLVVDLVDNKLTKSIEPIVHVVDLEDKITKCIQALVVDLEDKEPTKSVLVESEKKKPTSTSPVHQTVIVDPPVTQEQKSEPSPTISVSSVKALKENNTGSKEKANENHHTSSATVNLPKKEAPASIIKRKARLKISPRLSDTQRNQRLAQFCYNVEPRLIHKMPSVEEKDEHLERPDNMFTSKVSGSGAHGNCVVKLSRLPLKVEKIYLRKLQYPKKELSNNITSQTLPEEEKSVLYCSHGPKNSEGRNKGRSISKKRKIPVEKDFLPSPGGKILRIRNGNEVMCTKIMSKTVEPSEKTRCTFCGKLTQSTNVWRHLLAVYKTKADIDEAIDEDASTFKCTECGGILCSKAALGIHTHHLHAKPNQYECKCPCCSESFLTNVSLACHMATHYQDIRKECNMSILPNEEPPKLLHCCLCRRSFITFPALETHLKVHNDKTKINQCKVCLKTFSKTYQLKCHAVVHTELRPFKCEQCGKTFRFKSSLRAHNYFHMGIQPFKCKVCDKGFYAGSKLAKHMHNVHKEATGLIPEYHMTGKSDKVVSRIKLVKVKSPQKKLKKYKETPGSSVKTDVLLKNRKENDVAKNTFKVINMKKKGHSSKESKDNKKHGSKIASQEVIKQKPVEEITVMDKPDSDVQIVAAVSQEQSQKIPELPNFISNNSVHNESRPSVVTAMATLGAPVSGLDLSKTGSTVPKRIVIPPDNHQESSALAQLEHLSRTMLQVSESRQNPLELYKNLQTGHIYHQQSSSIQFASSSEENSMLFHLLTAKSSAAVSATNGVANNGNEEFKVSSLCDLTGNEFPFENMARNVVLDMTMTCVLCDATYITSLEMADHLSYYHRVTPKNVNNIMMFYCK